MKAWTLFVCVALGGCSYHRVAVDVQIQSQITPVIPLTVSCKIDLQKEGDPMDNESKATRNGPIPREQRKQLRILDLQCVSPERRKVIRQETVRALEHVRTTTAAQRANGIEVTDDLLNARTATYLLTLECLDVIDNDIPI